MDGLAILVSLALLMYLAYRGISVLILAPLLACLALLLSGEGHLMLPTYTHVFMQELGAYVIKFFPLFMLGSLFGQLIADTGAASTLARGLMNLLGPRHAMLTVVLACAVLTYGGVSLFVVAFAVYPVGAILFRASGTPKRFLPGAIALGSFTFTMTALPGSPSIQNAIPTLYLGTTTFAAPGLGIVCGLFMLVLGVYFLRRWADAAISRGEGYGEHQELQLASASENKGGPPLWSSVLPVALVIVLNGLLSLWWLPALDMGFLQGERFGSPTASSVIGLWSVLLSLITAICATLLLHWRRVACVRTSLNQGVFGSFLPIFNTASEVAYGAIIAKLAGFAAIRQALMEFSPGNPLISVVLTLNVLSGITGSSSGGLSIALRTMGNEFVQMIQAAGFSPDLLHRVAVISAGGLDTLPHSGAVITLLAICGLTHRQAYPPVLLVTIAMPVTATLLAVALGTIFGSF